MKNFIIVISGPSGAGKGTIIKEILKKNPQYRLMISYTTRKKRKDEVDGKDYNFISYEEFKKLIEEKKLLEYNKYDGNYYGTPKIQFDNENEVLLIETNAENGLLFKKYNTQIITIYILPRNEEQLIKQRGNRGNKRHELGKKEISIAKKYDWLVINKNLDEAIEDVENIIRVILKNSLITSDNINYIDNFYSKE